MTFTIDGQFVWDFWTAYDEARGVHHLFHLHAPTSLGDPELRHRNARIGHAVSADLRTWSRLPDPLPDLLPHRSPPPAGFDDLASWTGCVVRGQGSWWMFITGLARSDDGRVQRIGAATSADLTSWTRGELLLEADPAYYQLSSESWVEEAWRDPWVVRDEYGQWHMYVTARDASGAPGCGVVGHAVSDDLVDWEVQPALSSPTGLFEWLEVISVVRVEGRWVLLFSCLSTEMPMASAGAGGIWSVPVEGPGSPVDVSAAVRITDESLYVGKVVEHLGSAYFMAFRNRGPDAAFVGGITDPVPVTWRPDGRGLMLTSGSAEPVV